MVKIAKHPIENLIGKKFNSLTVLSEGSKHVSPRGKPLRKLTCLCDCGVVKDLFLQAVILGAAKKCGKCREFKKKHGMSKTITYSSWNAMIGRCKPKNTEHYKNYFGRGITICEEWQESFNVFYKDMGERPTKGHTIDRIDNNKGYYKDNCRWATKGEQNRNQRKNVFITHNGEKMCIADWADRYNISRGALGQRVFTLNWGIEKALTHPIAKTKRANIDKK